MSNQHEESTVGNMIDNLINMREALAKNPVIPCRLVAELDRIILIFKDEHKQL